MLRLPSLQQATALFSVSLTLWLTLSLTLGLLLGGPAWAANETPPLSEEGATISTSAPTEAGVYKAGVSITDALKRRYPLVNANDVQTLAKGNHLKLKITTVVGDGLNTVGDEFYARLSQDYFVGDKLVLPHGSVVHGTLNQLTPPKRAGRNGTMGFKFDYIITPDGREIPLTGQANTADPKWKAAAKVVGKASGMALGGGVIGALMSVRFGGLALIAASQGYSLAGGAAIGAAVGLTHALMKKGEVAMLQPNAEIQLKLNDALLLPSLTPTQGPGDGAAAEMALPGLQLKLLGLHTAKDPFGELKELNLSVEMSNQSELAFSSFDMALMDEEEKLYYASPFGETGLWFQRLEANSTLKGHLSFNVEDPKATHYLVFFKPYPREMVAKFVITPQQVISNTHTPKKQKAS